MANTTRRSTSTGSDPGAFVPVVVLGSVVAAGAAIWYSQPGLVLAWLGLWVASLMHPAPELTGKKDSHGRLTPGNLTEERQVADHRAWASLRWRLLSPGPHWLPGWPPLGYWLACVAVSVLAYALPVSELELFATHDSPGVQTLGAVLAEFGRWMNVAAAFVTSTAVAATVRQRAGDDCPGTRMDALVTLAQENPVRTAAVSLAAPAVLAVGLLAAARTDPAVPDLLARVPVWVWVVLGLALALGAQTPFLRELSLDPWRRLVAARREWDGRWPAVKMHDPMATLVQRLQVGSNTVDVFDAPPSVGSAGYIVLAPKLAPVIGAGRTVVVLNHPQTGTDGAPMPGTVDPVRFRVVAIDDAEPVDLADPAADQDVVRTLVEAGMAQATDAMGLPRPSLVELEPVHAPGSPRAAYRATFAGLGWAGLRPQVGMLPPFMGCEVLVDHRGAQMFVGALLTEPAEMADASLPGALADLAEQDRWNLVWGAASLARHKVSQPTVSPPQCATATLADGTKVQRTVFITRQGIPPNDYFGREDAVAASLNGAPFVAITGFRGAGARQGERHPQAMCVYHSTQAVPSTLDALAPVEGASVPQVDETTVGDRGGRRPGRRPARRGGRPGGTAELATHWVVAGMVNSSFESSKLRRPEVVEARCLTVPSPRGPHLWRIQLRLHEGTTLGDVRSGAEKLRQSLGVPWLRVSAASDGVILYAGTAPDRAQLVNPVTDRATLVSLDWERAFDDAGLVSGAGEVPALLEVGHLPRNPDVQVLDFALPSGLSIDRVKGALKKLMASTGNEFVEPRPSPRGASAFRLLVAPEHPLPERVDFDFGTAASDRRFIYFGTGIEGEPVGWEVSEQPHVLLAGLSGAGKSVLAQNFLWGWAAHGDLVVVIDPMKQAADFQFLTPYAAGFAVDVMEGAALLRAVHAEVTRRMRLNAEHKVGSYLDLPDDVRPPRILVFIDEFTSLMGKDPVPAASTDPEIMEERARIEALNEARSQIGTFSGKVGREARSAGVHLALATQALKSDLLAKVPGGSDLKTNLARTLLGNSTQGDRMSALRNPMDAPALGETIPKGRGLWEPLNLPAAIAVQTWFAGQRTLGEELAARIEPLPESERIDYSRFMPRSEEDDHTYGPPPGFGDDLDPEEQLVDVDDLVDLDLQLDLSDLESDDPGPDLTAIGDEPDPGPHDDPAPEVHDEHDDERTAPGGEGPPPEHDDPFPHGLPSAEDRDPDEGEGEDGPPQDRPGLVAAAEGEPATVPVAGGADAAGDGVPGGGGGPGPDPGLVPDGGGDGDGADEPVVGAAAAEGVVVRRVSGFWDEEDFEVPAGSIPVAPDRSGLTADDLFG